MNITDVEMPDQTTLKKRDLRRMLNDYERNLVLCALEVARGNQSRAALALGVGPSTLCQKIKRLGIRNRASAIRSRVSNDYPSEHDWLILK